MTAFMITLTSVILNDTAIFLNMLSVNNKVFIGSLASISKSHRR